MATSHKRLLPEAAMQPRLRPFIPSQAREFSFLMSEDFEEKHNVAWRVEPGEEDPLNPLLTPKYPWESAAVFSHGTVMKDPIDGRWKMWNISTPDTAPSCSADRRLTYAESDDGVHWNRPLLDICPQPGYPRTNILLDMDSGGPSQHASVLVHPEAPPDYRYEMFILRGPGYYCQQKIVTGFPLPPGKRDHTVPDIFSLYRYRSSDGIHWHAWEQVGLDTGDSLWINQVQDGSYVAYHKMDLPAFPGGVFPYDIGLGYCRILSRRTSPDGTQWSPYQPVLTPDWRDAHDTQFMELTTLPQTGGLLGVATVYHVLNQSIDLQFAASRDGKRWWRPDRRPCVPLKPLGEYGGGMIWPMQPMIQENGRVYLYYSGCQGLHNDSQSSEPLERLHQTKLMDWPHRNEGLSLPSDVYTPLPGCLWFQGAICRVSWPEGRMWAAVTASGGDLEGLLTTAAADNGGRRLEVNAVTVQGGALEAELLQDGRPVPGFGRADCTPFQGDSKRAAIAWKGGSRCPAGQSKLRFYFGRTRLYGFEWVAKA